MRHGVKLLGVLALGAMVLAAACGGTSDGDKTKTAAAGGATTPAATQPAATPGTTAVATTAAQATTYPLTVTDMLGRSVTIAAKPAAIAAISPTTVEYVFAVGATSKTRSTSAKFPAAATAAKDIGSAYQPSLELIAAEAPDLIVADSVLQPQLLSTLEALNVPVLYIGAQGFSDVPKGLRLIGEVLDAQAAGEKAAAALQ